MRVEVNKKGKLDIFTDSNDLCFNCRNKSACPLVEALRTETVFLHYEEIDITKCGLFKNEG